MLHFIIVMLGMAFITQSALGMQRSCLRGSIFRFLPFGNQSRWLAQKRLSDTDIDVIQPSRFYALKRDYENLVRELLSSTLFIQNSTMPPFRMRALAIADLTDGLVLHAITQHGSKPLIYPMSGEDSLIQFVDSGVSSKDDTYVCFSRAAISCDAAGIRLTEEGFSKAFDGVVSDVASGWHYANWQSPELFAEQDFIADPADWILFSKVARWKYDFQLLEIFMHKSNLQDKAKLTRSPILYGRDMLCLWVKKEDFALVQEYFDLSVDLVPR